MSVEALICFQFSRCRIFAVYGIVCQALLFLKSLLRYSNKDRLDQFWINQESKFDFRAVITGIGIRSINSLSCVYKCLIGYDTDI